LGIEQYFGLAEGIAFSINSITIAAREVVSKATNSQLGDGANVFMARSLLFIHGLIRGRFSDSIAAT